MRLAIVTVLFAGLMAPLWGQSVEEALDQLYRFQFQEAHRSLDRIVGPERDNPLVHVTRASVYLFAEMDRMGILASEFYQDRGQKLRRNKVRPLAAARESIEASLAKARELANGQLRSGGAGADVYFALAMVAGVECNYTVFVEKKMRGALRLARLAHDNALRTLEADPGLKDARLFTGINEYLVGSLPFFVRWFVSFEQVSGDKRVAVAQLEQVAQSGRYLGTMAKMVLAMIHLREKRYGEAFAVTSELAEQYPENPLFRRERAKLEELAGQPASTG